MSKFVLILAIIGYCFTAEDKCKTTFEGKLKTQCEKTSTGCQYFSSIQTCTTTNICEDGNANTCSSIIPSDFDLYKCQYNTANSKCEKTLKVCSDFNKETWDHECEELKAPDGKGNRCKMSYSNVCTPHFDLCKDAPKDQCNGNIPSNYKKKCVWENDKCNEKDRLCSETYYEITSSTCKDLKSSDTNKNCFYLEKTCKDYYKTCESYTGKNKTICENIKPLNNAEDDYDISKNCTFDSTADKCITRDIMCKDYILSENKEDNETCFSLKTSDTTNKICIFDFEQKICREEYESCSAYNSDLNSVKKKEICENITLTAISKKCVFKNNLCEETDKKCSDYQSYQPKEYCTNINLGSGNPKICKYIDSKCIEDYKDCDAYEGTDKETCESICVDGRKCFLEHDNDCKLKPLTCSDIKTQLQCLRIQEIPENSRKKCFFYNNQCIEMYKTCEDYNGYYKQECETIIPLNGYNCVFQSPSCKSIPKTCSEGLVYYECQYITAIKDGLSDPRKMICDYDSSTGKCFENYKYCNDYTGTDAAICEKINPYDSEKGTPDPSYKCVYNEKFGCERKLLGCSEVNTSTRCAKISDILNEASGKKKYCAFFNGTCSEQYFKCTDYDESVKKDVCEAIIPDNYETTHCVYKDISGKITCEEEAKTCKSFNIGDYQYECIKSGPFCSYSDGVCSTVKKACNDIVFPVEWEADEDDKIEACQSVEVENENKICSVSEDGTKCEEADKPSEKQQTPASGSSATTSTQNNQNSESQGDSSDSSNLLQLKGINLILILLYLLF